MPQQIYYIWSMVNLLGQKGVTFILFYFFERMGKLPLQKDDMLCLSVSGVGSI